MATTQASALAKERVHLGLSKLVTAINEFISHSITPRMVRVTCMTHSDPHTLNVPAPGSLQSRHGPLTADMLLKKHSLQKRGTIIPCLATCKYGQEKVL